MRSLAFTKKRASPQRRPTTPSSPASPRRAATAAAATGSPRHASAATRYVRYTPGLLAAISVFLIVVVNHVELLFISNMEDYLKFPTPGDQLVEGDVVKYSPESESSDAESEQQELQLQQQLQLQEDRVLLDAAATPADQPLFVVLADGRSGASWTMSILNQHPHVCAAGSFDAGALLPMGFTWLPDNDANKACTYVYIRDQVRDLTKSGEGQAQCQTDYLASDAAVQSHKLGSNLPRLCQFIAALNQNFTDEAILDLYIHSFRAEQFMTCTCPPESRTRGLKVVAAWAKELPLHSTSAFTSTDSQTGADNSKSIGSTKIVRWHRANLWARYMSQKIAEATNIWTPASKAEKEQQLQALRDKKELLTIDIDDMLDAFFFMQRDDDEADTWAQTHALSTDHVLWLEHEACLSDMEICFGQLYDFLGVNSSHITEQASLYTPAYELSNSKRMLDFVSNADLVREALGANGMGQFIGMKVDDDDPYQLVQHLVYVPLGHVNRMTDLFPGVKTVVMEGANEKSTKLSAAVPLLKAMNADTLVVLTDSHGVAVNHHIRQGTVFYKSLLQFRNAFATLTRDVAKSGGAVVVSASSQCCASALSHIVPGALFDDNNQRRGRACQSGHEDCVWNSDENAAVWQRRMKDLAIERSAITTQHVYLDASLIAGKAKDVLALIAAVDASHTEDERAVLTDYMHRNPDKIILDYDQRMFTKGFDGYRTKRNIDCSFDVDSALPEETPPVTDKKTAMPLFSHVPRDLGCTVQRDNTTLRFPMWHADGIALDPLVKHINDLSVSSESAFGIDMHFGPEMLYVVDDQGVWAAKKLRARIANETEYYRNTPTNEMLKIAHGLLRRSMSDQASASSTRWRSLQKSIASGVGFFFFGWYGDFKECNYHNKGQDSIPIFTTCAIQGCDHAFPSPAYMTLIDSQISMSRWHTVFRSFDRDYPWEKKIRKVLWRGALSENDPTKVFQSARWRLCLLAANSQHKDLFDVGLVNIPKFLTDQISIDVSLVGGLVGPISPMKDFQKYLAVLDMDGNSWSSRFGTLLCYNSVTVKVEPLYVDHFFHDLVPWLHYIPIKNDLSDLEENMVLIMDPKNEVVVKNIIAAANRWCSERFIYNELAKDQLDIWEAYVQKLDQHDPNWSQKWTKTKTDLFASDLDLQVVTDSTGRDL